MKSFGGPILALFYFLIEETFAGSTFCGNCIDSGYRYCNKQGYDDFTDFRTVTSESVKSANLAKCCTSDTEDCYYDKMRRDTSYTLCT